MIRLLIIFLTTAFLVSPFLVFANTPVTPTSHEVPSQQISESKGRLLKATTTTQASNYGYDHTGSRVFLKEGPSTGSGQATTTYANKYYSTSSATTTKHIFANGQLVSTVEVTAGGGGGTPETIAYDATSNSGSKLNVSSFNWSHTTSGTNRLLVVGVAMNDSTDSDRTVTGITYNSVAMTNVREDDNDADNNSTSLWYLANPSSGANTIAVTLNGTNSGATGAAISLTGVDQLSPLDAQNGSTLTNNNSLSTSVTTIADNAWVVDIIFSEVGSQGTPAVGAGQTRVGLVETTPFDSAISYEGPKTPAGSVTMSWSNTVTGGADWSQSAASFKPATSEGGGETATTTSYIHTDHLSGTSAITDDSDELVQTLDYYPFGSLRVDKQETNFNEKRKFTGYEFDDSTGLNYAGARYQNPSEGRFTSQDPASRDNPGQFLADPQQMNMYSYARNNPLILVDPTGNGVNPSPIFMSWHGYDVTCLCRDNGLILKTGEVFGGRDRALEAIARNHGNIQAASRETGVSENIIRSIYYEEQSHLVPGEALYEQAFFDRVNGGVGEMQVSMNTALSVGADPRQLDDPQRNILTGAKVIQNIQQQGATTPYSIGKAYNSPSSAHGDRYGQRIESYSANSTYQPNLVENLTSLVKSLTQLVQTLSNL
ncbi:MAG: hypothetical protein COU90_01205 [Candidatus Ryanbacteria bacterium CG10_big_fil_rev_8_21_14_0_10_43_42]|uniref:Uncharacterized protein n=1 Tax=Candidatus Ryanbacteria bacterium CG10_big_fil_rev_8_21_14_0_10_43_42 TaxID=1974864 RepID=A0A2M8KY53_9BACT|nr:MAG: hypothetical protein COU90_01205 [Candidatus Ryanbacteria bacterium CG10_big_fil_rev_8_21_14_0_10_43_42]